MDAICPEFRFQIIGQILRFVHWIKDSKNPHKYNFKRPSSILFITWREQKWSNSLDEISDVSQSPTRHYAYTKFKISYFDVRFNSLLFLKSIKASDLTRQAGLQGS